MQIESIHVVSFQCRISAIELTCCVDRCAQSGRRNERIRSDTSKYDRQDFQLTALFSQ